MLEELIGKSKNKKQSVAIGLLAVAFLIGWNAMAKPMLSKIKNVENSKAELLQKEPVLRDIETAEKKLATYKPALLDSRDRAALIGQLNAIAERSSLVINSITPEESPGGDVSSSLTGDFEKVIFRIEASGSYHALGQFISQIESLPRFSKIIKMEIGGIEMQGASGFQAGGRPITMTGKSSYRISVSIGFLFPPRGLLG